MTWIDCGTYYISSHPQGGNEWKKIRTERSLTMSELATAVGHNTLFTTPEQLARQKAGLEEKIFSEKSKFVMAHGTKTESSARNHYSKVSGNKVTEVGLAVPKWDMRIGGSPDGLVGHEGLIEIKCPLKMYNNLINHIENKNIKDDLCKHIYRSHYDQMQGCMAIMDKKWCDYIVYSTEDQLIYIERINFNKIYWDEVLYPGINNFIDNILNPLLKDDSKYK